MTNSESLGHTPETNVPSENGQTRPHTTSLPLRKLSRRGEPMERGHPGPPLSAVLGPPVPTGCEVASLLCPPQPDMSPDIAPCHPGWGAKCPQVRTTFLLRCNLPRVPSAQGTPPPSYGRWGTGSDSLQEPQPGQPGQGARRPLASPESPDDSTGAEAAPRPGLRRQVPARPVFWAPRCLFPQLQVGIQNT